MFFSECDVLLGRQRGAACRRPPFLDPGMVAILNVFLASVFAEFLYGFGRFSVSWGSKGKAYLNNFNKQIGHRKKWSLSLAVFLSFWGSREALDLENQVKTL